jgi:hypothetical protein
MKIAQNTTTKSRLIDFLKFKNIKKSQFYKSTGLGNGFLDKNNNVNSDKIEIIASYYPDLNIKWLITGKGEMLQGAEPVAQRPEAVKEPMSPPPIGNDAITIYKELLREKDEEIKALNRRVWEFERKDELIKKLEAEIKRLKNELEELQSDVGERHRTTDDKVQPVPLVPPRIIPPPREYIHPE